MESSFLEISFKEHEIFLVLLVRVINFFDNKWILRD